MLQLPEVMAIAGPNGFGKSTVTSLAKTVGVYLNADDIKRATQCSDMEAAIKAEELREACLAARQDFTFETVLSTPRNLDLLRRAKQAGYFTRCIYILTVNPDINVSRVAARVFAGGHGVPEDKIRKRYHRAMELLPQVIDACDIIHVYDNSGSYPFRIFKKRKDKCFAAENEFWSMEDIHALTGIQETNPFPGK